MQLFLCKNGDVRLFEINGRMTTVCSPLCQKSLTSAWHKGKSLLQQNSQVCIQHMFLSEALFQAKQMKLSIFKLPRAWKTSPCTLTPTSTYSPLATVERVLEGLICLETAGRRSGKNIVICTNGCLRNILLDEAINS